MRDKLNLLRVRFGNEAAEHFYNQALAQAEIMRDLGTDFKVQANSIPVYNIGENLVQCDYCGVKQKADKRLLICYCCGANL